MLHPVGRLPERTYWRRRVVLVAALLLTVLLVKNLLLSGGSSDAATATGRQQAGPPRQSALPASTVRKTPQPTSRATPTPMQRPTPTATAERRQARPAHRPVPTCSPRSLALFVGSARDFYRVGQIADLTLTVVNMTGTACRADIGPRVQDALVYHGTQRLWSSNDCYPGSESAVETLSPGEPRRLVIRWSGDTSRPGCAGRRVRVGAGRYTVVGEVGAVRGRSDVTYRN